MRDLKRNTPINLLLREVKDYTKLKKIWGGPISYSPCLTCGVWRPDHCYLKGFHPLAYLGHSFTNATKRIKRAIREKTHPSPSYESDSDSDTSSTEHDSDSDPSSTEHDSDSSEDSSLYDPSLVRSKLPSF